MTLLDQLSQQEFNETRPSAHTCQIVYTLLFEISQTDPQFPVLLLDSVHESDGKFYFH